MDTLRIICTEEVADTILELIADAEENNQIENFEIIRSSD